MRVISADSHMMEPPDLWQERLDKKYKDRAPKVIQGHEGKKGYFFVVEGIRPFPVAGGFAAGNKPEDLPKAWEKGYEGAGQADGTRLNVSRIKILTAWKRKYCTQRSACRCLAWMTPGFNKPASLRTMTGLRSFAAIIRSDSSVSLLFPWKTFKLA